MLYIFNQQAPAVCKLFWTSILLRVSYNTYKALCKCNSPRIHTKKSLCLTSTWIPKLTSWFIKQNRRTSHTWLTKELFTNSRAGLMAFLRRLMNSFLQWKVGNKFQRYKGGWRDTPAQPSSCTAPARHQAVGSLVVALYLRSKPTSGGLLLPCLCCHTGKDQTPCLNG